MYFKLYEHDGVTKLQFFEPVTKSPRRFGPAVQFLNHFTIHFFRNDCFHAQYINNDIYLYLYNNSLKRSNLIGCKPSVIRI